MIDPAQFKGRVTCITGHEKNCGKTQFMNYLAHELAFAGSGTSVCGGLAVNTNGHEAPAVISCVHGAPSNESNVHKALRGSASVRTVPAGEKNGARLAVMTAGYDGESSDLLSGAKKPLIKVYPGTIVVTPERFLKTSLILPEILEVVPGSTSLGTCCIARARRAGTVTLASGEGNASLRWTLDFLTSNRLADTILIDGAFNRITQVGAWPGAQLVYVLRVDPINFKKSLENIERLLLLLSLNAAALDTVSPGPGGFAQPGITLSGAPAQPAGNHDDTVCEHIDVLSLETIRNIPERARTIIIEDFTHVFLPLRELKALLHDKQLLVKRTIPCAGIPVIVRGISFHDFFNAVPDLPLKHLMFQNPYEHL